MKKRIEIIRCILLLLASLCLVSGSFPVYADTSARYSTGQNADGAAKSLNWTQIAEDTWTLDADKDGKSDVTLKSETDAAGNQVWTYTFNVADSSAAYYIYEEMTGSALPLTDGYTSSGSDGKDAIPQDPGVKAKDGTETYTITNTKNHSTSGQTGTGSLKLTKQVTGTMADPEEKFVFEITLSGSTDALKEKVQGAKIFGDVPFMDGAAKVSLGKGESVSMTGIPVGLSYSISEEVPSGYGTPEKTNATGTIAKDENSDIWTETETSVWTNVSAYTPSAEDPDDPDTPTAGAASFTVKKTVTGAAKPAEKVYYAFSVLIENLTPEQTYTYTVSGTSAAEDTGTAASGTEVSDGTAASGAEFSAETAVSGTGDSFGAAGSDAGTSSGTAETMKYSADADGTADVRLFLADGESAAFSGIPAGASYQVLESQGEYNADGTSFSSGTLQRILRNGDTLKAQTSAEDVGGALQTEPSAEVTDETAQNVITDENAGNSASRTEKVVFVPGYRLKESGSSGSIISAEGSVEAGKDLATAKETAEAGESAVITFTNNYPAVQNLTVRKWMEKAGTEGSARYAGDQEFSFSIEFKNLPEGTAIASDIGKITADEYGEAVRSFRLKADGTPVIFRDLPAGTKYRITETGGSCTPSFSISVTDSAGNAVTGTVAQKEKTGTAGRRLATGGDTGDGFETVEENESDTVTFVNKEPETIVLPATGGRGIIYETMCGLIFIMAAALVFLHLKRCP